MGLRNPQTENKRNFVNWEYWAIGSLAGCNPVAERRVGSSPTALTRTRPECRNAFSTIINVNLWFIVSRPPWEYRQGFWSCL